MDQHLSADPKLRTGSMAELVVLGASNESPSVHSRNHVSHISDVILSRYDNFDPHVNSEL